MKPLVIFISGASSGIGKAAANLLHDQGHIVYAGARRVELLSESIAGEGRAFFLDVTDENSAKACVKEILAREGRIDVLINNAGFGLTGAIEDLTADQARLQFEVNLFGMVRLVNLVLPQMRKQGGGRIINITSLAGRYVMPYDGWYHASKYAAEAVSDALRMENRRRKVKVVLIEPGGVNTAFFDCVEDELCRLPKESVHAEVYRKLSHRMKHFNYRRFLTPPEKIAKMISKAVHRKNPRARYTGGTGSGTILFLKFLLPDRLFDRIIEKIFV